MTEATAPKYTVEDLASELGIKPASARVALRKHNVEKHGKVYGWDNQADMKAVAAKLKSSAGDSKKPAKKAVKKAAVKKKPAVKPATDKAE